MNDPRLSADRWSEIRAALDAALALPPAQRSAFVAGAVLDPAVRSEVLSLLEHAEAAEAEVDLAPSAPRGVTSPVAPAAHTLDGQRLGRWSVVGRLGHGGMAEVYRARRNDGAYDAEAAIKVLKPGMDSAALLARFALEQRALARLNHPHIARLFDAGLTPDQRPYFVMELVEGQPIDRAARSQPLEERLRLFLQLADAVSYAHRQLLVHRDLKPGNVLVDQQAQVKLLDFGIAKALEGSDGESATTHLGQRPFTPHYASPEQVRGEPVGTGTDIYSLGVLLYEMLTGARPTGRQATTPIEAARSVIEEEPTRPSRLTVAEAGDPQWHATRRRLAGDLDNVLLKALEKPPERRYASVDAMAADVRAFLAGYPVSARAASPAYLLWRFVGRHRWAVLAAGVGGLGLVIGLVAAVTQGREAVAVGGAGMALGLGLALAQARGAARARDAAQARFEDLRQLAHAVLFDYHDLVEPLAGSTPVRRRLVDDAIVYLDRMSKAAPDDRRVLLEIGMAYRTVGVVQRNGFRRPHLGDTAGALRSYESAIDTLRRLVDGDERDEAAAYELALALSARAGLLGEDMQLAAARAGLAEAAALFARHLSSDTPDLRHRLELARTHLRLAGILVRHQRYDEALGRVDDGRRTLESLAQLQPDHKELPHVWVWVHNLESNVARERGDWPGMITSQEKGRTLLLALAQAEPDNARYREDLASNARWLTSAYGRLGQVAQVTRWAEEAVSRWRRIARADPEDRNARSGYLFTLASTGWAFVEAGAPDEGLRRLEAAAVEVDDLAQRFQSEYDMRSQQATFAVVQALARVATGRAAAPEDARRLVEALTRDSSGMASATVPANATQALCAALELAGTSGGADAGAWLQRSREALHRLGVR